MERAAGITGERPVDVHARLAVVRVALVPSGDDELACDGEGRRFVRADPQVRQLAGLLRAGDEVADIVTMDDPQCTDLVAFSIRLRVCEDTARSSVRSRPVLRRQHGDRADGEQEDNPSGSHLGQQLWVPADGCFAT
jgi:hypothetical protein